MAISRLTELRRILSAKQTDLQKLYRFNFKSTKLLLFNADTYITSITHPQYNYTNQGDYKGYIASVVKPGEITITFLEDQQHTINYVLDIWESLKYNKLTGVHFPKAAYEDQALLIYEGEYRFPSLKDDFEKPLPINVNNVPPVYSLLGFYPINREPITLNYSSNEVQLISVTFNVDDVKLISGIATAASQVASAYRSTVSAIDNFFKSGTREPSDGPSGDD